MSSVYATEPATSGRVILETTHGPIDIQLWCRECPETTRFFLQLCMDGFYNNMVFHRIIPSFLIQTGALRQPPVEIQPNALEKYRSAVQANRAWERRKYEVHSRLHFNHRGQVAMALGVDDDEDEEIHPQFFITLDETSHLDGKHVLFGTVVGPTLFNAIRIGQTDVEENAPAGDLAYAPRVTSVKIVENPIHTSLAPQAVVPWHVKEEKDPSKRKRKRKGKRDMNVLSFGDEMEEEMELTNVGMKSSHDVLESKKLSKNVDAAVKESLAKKTEQGAPAEKEKPTDALSSSEDMNETSQRVDVDDEHGTREEELSVDEEPNGRAVSTQVKTPPSRGFNPNEDNTKKSRVKNTSHKEENLLEIRRAKYAKGRKSKKERENETIEKLFAFRSKVQSSKKTERSSKSEVADSALASRMARRIAESDQPLAEDAVPFYHGQILESDDEKTGSDWMQTRFKCRRHMDLALREEDEGLVGGDGRRIDEYEVLDDKKRSKHHKSKHEKSHKRRKEHDRKTRS
jgi:peptidyl-prolyl cis-trans isomerase SDCCAG10